MSSCIIITHTPPQSLQTNLSSSPSSYIVKHCEIHPFINCNNAKDPIPHVRIGFSYFIQCAGCLCKRMSSHHAMPNQPLTHAPCRCEYLPSPLIQNLVLQPTPTHLPQLLHLPLEGSVVLLQLGTDAPRLLADLLQGLGRSRGPWGHTPHWSGCRARVDHMVGHMNITWRLH